jgi:hypothetical protein
MRWEDKAWFRERLRRAGLQVVHSTVVGVEELTRANCRTWRRKWERRLVIQIPDFPRGGGRGTFCLTHEDEVERLRGLLLEGRYMGHAFREVMVSPWIEGPSLSMAGCVTPRGVLCSPLQTQLLDLPEVLRPGDAGRFCGHQWGVPKYPSKIEDDARGVIEWVGKTLRAEGYRGLFGVDFGLDEAQERLYALECNPRYTGAFPTLTLLQHGLGLPPMEAFHLLSWSEGEVFPSIEGLNRTYREMPPASQLLLFHRGERASRISGELEGGRYRWDDEAERALRVEAPLPLPPPPWDPMEFLILEGPPPRGSELLSGHEMDLVLRVVFFRPIIREGGELIPFGAAVARWVYRCLGIGNG